MKIKSTKETIEPDFYNLNTYKKVNEGSEIAILGLGSFFELGKKVQAKLRDNLNYRRKSTITTKGTYKSGSVLKIESYLAAIGFQNKEEN